MRQFLSSASLLGIAAVGLLTGCPDRTISQVQPEQGRVEYKDIPVNVNRNVDILFVIDDSPSMADKQANLARNFPEFINVLNTIQGGLPDVHIGVVTSDVGSQGAEDSAPGPSIGSIGNGGCSGAGKKGELQTSGAPLTAGSKFISDIKNTDGTRQQNFTGNLADVFATMAKVGAGGCGFEQHLEAMKRALNNNPVNAGFLRPDAYLAVIFIADEDDCSMAHSTMLGPESAALGPLTSFRCTRFGVTCDQNGATSDAMNQVGTKGQCHPNDASQYLEKVKTYTDFLKQVKTDPSKVIVAGIMGTIDPFQVELRSSGGGPTTQALAHSCSYVGANGQEVADPPIRIKFLLDQFPNRSTFTTICQSNLQDGLILIAQLLKSVIGDPCINGKLAEPVDCSVSDVANFGKVNQTETVLAQCNTTNSNIPCWHVVKDAAKCPTDPATGANPDNYVLVIERGGATPPNDTHVISYCVTEAQ